MNAMNPAANEKIAVRVPDWNMPHKTQILIMEKNNFSNFILLVIAIIKNVTHEAAALQP
jgi:hypothetical protein